MAEVDPGCKPALPDRKGWILSSVDAGCKPALPDREGWILSSIEIGLVRVSR